MSSNPSVYEIENDIIRRSRNKEKLPPAMFNPGDVVHVASLYWKDVPFDNFGQFGREYMPPGLHHPREIAKDPEKYPPVYMSSRDFTGEGEPGICGAFLPIDKGNDEREPKYQPASERAKDIANRYAQFGVFVVANGMKPTRAECEKALKMLEATYRHRIEMSDEQWRKTGSVALTVSNAPTALKYFGLERDWAERAGEQEVCPYCSRSVKSKAVKCGNDNCGAILNWAEAYKGGIVSKQDALDHGVKLSQ